MKESPSRSDIERILTRDPAWSAYARANLNSAENLHTDWLLTSQSLLMIYRGFEIPVLYAQGDPLRVPDLCSSLPDGTYIYTLQGSHRVALGQRFQVETETKMWRMALREAPVHWPDDHRVRRLTLEDLEEVVALFAGHPDRPDSFQARQLEHGVYYGVDHNGRLSAVAGTHILAPAAGCAALGNVFTHPAERRRGLGSAVTGAVTRTLVEMGIRTLVLNVAMHNTAAIRSYARLGFMPYCGYYEGLAHIIPLARRGKK